MGNRQVIKDKHVEYASDLGHGFMKSSFFCSASTLHQIVATPPLTAVNTNRPAVAAGFGDSGCSGAGYGAGRLLILERRHRVRWRARERLRVGFW